MTTRVLQVLGYSTGGIARHVADIVRALDQSHGLVIDIAGPEDLPVALPKPLYPVTIPDGLFGHRRTVRSLARLIGASGYDVVHAHGLRAGIDAGLAGRKASVLNIASVHNILVPAIAGRARARVLGPMEGLVVRLNQRVLAPSEDIARRLERRSSSAAGRIEVLHLGVGDPPAGLRGRAEVRSELGVVGSTRLIVTVARLAPQKALHVLIEGLSSLPDTVTAVVGDGPLEQELRAQADAAGVADRMRWLGALPAPWDIVRAADVFVLSSHWEACSLAAQEAMTLGVPVVATDVGGMPELITDGVSGRLVPAADPAALAQALKDTLDDPSKGRSYAEAARRGLRRSFSTQQMMGRLRDIYLAAGRGR
ncbi:MAG TPA: glycosyltransferase family 4 protein [Thermoleophilaceae bacterium]|nr:glycosyltransferase family 4 protein [Thermoleophilaceae bacterium]